VLDSWAEHYRGVSEDRRKKKERQRREIGHRAAQIPEELGIHCQNRGDRVKAKRELSKDVNRLIRLWKSIRGRSLSAPPPVSLIHKEQGYRLRTLRITT